MRYKNLVHTCDRSARIKAMHQRLFHRSAEHKLSPGVVKHERSKSAQIADTTQPSLQMSMQQSSHKIMCDTLSSIKGTLCSAHSSYIEWSTCNFGPSLAYLYARMHTRENACTSKRSDAPILAIVHTEVRAFCISMHSARDLS